MYDIIMKFNHIIQYKKSTYTENLIIHWQLITN